MPGLRCELAVVLIAAQLPLASFCAAYSGDGHAWSPCPDGRTEVLGAANDEFALICSATRDAMAFFQDCGLKSPDSLRLTVTNERIQINGMDVFGCFDIGKEAIRLLDFEHCKMAAADNKAYARLSAVAFYRSVVVHEVAHSVFRSNLGERVLPLGAHEYAAFAAQISLMPEGVRQQFLSPIQRSPPTDLNRFADTILLMAPEIFGAMAYDHFSAAGNGCKVLRGLVDGRQKFPTSDEMD
jgi:Family of unknown function (DUF6639)